MTDSVTALSALAEHQQYPASTLYVVATPIGNVADLTLRALHVLQLVDRIAAEDTRNTGQLLARYNIGKPLISAHQHNEQAAADKVIAHLRSGERVAYVSDAGTPGISDPGGRLVDAVRAAGLAVVPIPGCSALAAALSVAGSWAAGFTFVGFAPARASQRSTLFDSLRNHRHALVLYEAPHRIVETLAALAKAFEPAAGIAGNGAQSQERRVLIARELTKLHESLHVCTLGSAVEWLEGDPNRRRGEFVLVVEGAGERNDASSDAQPAAAQHDALLRILLAETTVASAARIATQLTGMSRQALYARALQLSAKAGDGDLGEGDEGRADS